MGVVGVVGAVGAARSGYMGHVVLMLKKLAKALEPSEGELAHQLALQPDLLDRWACFLDRKLQPVLDQHATPLVRTSPPTPHSASNSFLIIFSNSFLFCPGRLLSVE